MFTRWILQRKPQQRRLRTDDRQGLQKYHGAFKAREALRSKNGMSILITSYNIIINTYIIYIYMHMDIYVCVL